MKKQFKKPITDEDAKRLTSRLDDALSALDRLAEIAAIMKESEGCVGVWVLEARQARRILALATGKK